MDERPDGIDRNGVKLTLCMELADWAIGTIVLDVVVGRLHRREGIVGKFIVGVFMLASMADMKRMPTSAAIIVVATGQYVQPLAGKRNDSVAEQGQANKDSLHRGEHENANSHGRRTKINCN